MSQSGAYPYILNLRSRNLYITVFIIWGLTFLFGLSPFLFAQTVSDTLSFATLSSSWVCDDGISACTVSVYIKDASDVAIQGKQVTLQSDRGSLDTITQPVSVTDTFGMETGWICSSVAGTATITVLCDGKTISCSPAGTILTFGRPIMAISKILKNVRTNETGTSVPVNAGDTIEYILTAQNTGNETATDAVIVDTKAFDTFTSNPVIFIGMDTFPADTWAYTLVSSPSDTEWIAGVPAFGSASLKGLRWRFYFYRPGLINQVKFSVKVK